MVRRGGNDGMFVECVCMCVRRNVWMTTWMLICECESMQLWEHLFLCTCINICPILFQWLRKEKKWHLLFFVFGNCHLYQYYVMLGFQLRYYKGHMFLCQSDFTLFFSPLSVDQTHLFCCFLLFSITHFTWDPWCTGVPDHHCPCVSSLFPSGEGELLMLL